MNRRNCWVILLIAWVILGENMPLCFCRKHFYRNTRRQDVHKQQKQRKEEKSPVPVVISGIQLVDNSKRISDRTDLSVLEPILRDSISFDQDTNFRLGGDGHALTFIFGQALILGVGAILFAGRSLSQSQKRANKSGESSDELSRSVLEKIDSLVEVR